MTGLNAPFKNGPWGVFGVPGCPNTGFSRAALKRACSTVHVHGSLKQSLTPDRIGGAHASV